MAGEILWTWRHSVSGCKSDWMREDRPFQCNSSWQLLPIRQINQGTELANYQVFTLFLLLQCILPNSKCHYADGVLILKNIEPFTWLQKLQFWFSWRFKVFFLLSMSQFKSDWFNCDVLFYYLSICNTGHVRNPQTEAFLEFLDLPYLLDHASESGPGQARVALPGTYHSPWFCSAKLCTL